MERLRVFNTRTFVILLYSLSTLPTAVNGCSGDVQADMVFVLDASGSVGSSNFQTMLAFVQDLINDFEIASDKVRVGVQKYSSDTNTEFNLNTYYDKTTMMNAVAGISYTRGGTNTGGALEYLRTSMFTTNGGDRSNVANIGVILTDGRSNSYTETATQAANARNAGITIFSIGIGSGIPLGELNEMATDPDSDYVFAVSDFSALSGIKSAFQAQACPAVDGVWGSWGSYGSCSVTCGGGTQSRTRACDSPAASNGGADCSGSSTDTGSCNTQSCPVDGVWGSWGSYGSCSVTCEGGTQSRTRACDSPAASNGGADCSGSSTDTGSCNTQSCPIDGVWGSWQSWSSCSVTCKAIGTRSRLRACDSPANQHGGAPCPGSDTDTESCDFTMTLCSPGNGWAVQVYETTAGTPVDGGFSTWGQWSACSRTCGAGTRVRMRQCNQPVPKYGGSECSGDYFEKEICSNVACSASENYTQSCQDDNYFNCLDGACVHYLKRCDCVMDCTDGSDELTEYAGCALSFTACFSAAETLSPGPMVVLMLTASAVIFLQAQARERL